LLDKLEQISKISVPVMIPLVVALIGYVGSDLLNARQNVIEQKKVDLEYVKIAKDIVANVKPETDARIVNWAYQTLFQLSPVKVAQEDVNDLSDRRVPLPTANQQGVVGGISSPKAEWPWVVGLSAVQHPLLIFCNGTLIGPRTVLTAAHCVSTTPPQKITIVNPFEDGKEFRIGRSIPVTKIIVHPNFVSLPQSSTIQHNIALLELGVALPPPFAPISLQKSSDPPPGSPAWVAAFDTVSSQKINLLQATIPIVDPQTCAATYGDKVSAGDICAGFRGGGVDTCAGSSGGPLAVLNSMGKKYQVGIISWGEGCAQPEKYGVYTRVSSYADWIKQTVPGVVSEAPISAYR
jgi:secreted trypsin-like serine protease